MCISYDVKKYICVFILAVLMAGMTACASDSGDPGEEHIQIYYVNNSETAIISHDYEPAADMDDTERILPELIGALEQMPEYREYEAPLSDSMKLKGYSFGAGLLTLNFDQAYSSQDKIREILSRAAVVRTLTQIPEVESVVFQVEGQPLTGSDGSVVGNMTADTFIYNAGNEINKKMFHVKTLR